MTANQTNALIKNPHTKKAIAILQKFAEKEAVYKAAEKEAKHASELIRDAMIEAGATRIEVDIPGITGYITLAERVTYKAEALDEVDDEFKKSALDTDKVKAQATLTGELPAGVVEARTRYITKKFKEAK